jgi:hypothetical protein
VVDKHCTRNTVTCDSNKFTKLLSQERVVFSFLRGPLDYPEVKNKCLRYLPNLKYRASIIGAMFRRGWHELQRNDSITAGEATAGSNQKRAATTGTQSVAFRHPERKGSHKFDVKFSLYTHIYFLNPFYLQAYNEGNFFLSKALNYRIFVNSFAWFSCKNQHHIIICIFRRNHEIPLIFTQWINVSQSLIRLLWEASF